MLKSEYVTEFVGNWTPYVKAWDDNYKNLTYKDIQRFSKADLLLNPYVFITYSIQGVYFNLIGI